MNVYIFNVTNADQFVEDCTDFNLTEKGPFSYKMFSGRKILRSPEDEENATLTYYDFKNFQLNVNGTHGNLNDPFVTIDVPTLVLNQYLKDNINDTWIDALVKFILTLNGQSLFQKISADELLFKGKRISILDTLKSGWELLHPNQPFPNVGLKDNTFSLFKSHNVTYFGPFEIYANGAKMGHFKSWHGLLSLDRWFGEECNKIRGTDGTFFPPFVDKTRKLYVFVPNFCRSIYFIFEKEVFLKGIKLYRFILDPDIFVSKLKKPSNKCFCSPRNNSTCSIDGVTDLNPCLRAPIWLSLPHFLNAKPDIRIKTAGLSPNSSKHATFLDIEPTLGLPLRARIRFQANVEIKKQKFYTGDDIKCDKILPLIWFEYSGEISTRDAAVLRENVVKVIDHATLYKPIYLISGFMFAIVAVALGYFKYHQICPTNCSARFRKFISRFRGKIDKPIFKKSKESNQIL
ncbi:platelet glycoprotein 4-like [Tetranychus urticae]|uniref:platelet glycoprotein 4-like n=1 Tax=Tetranychus urticae TaxID=32264 RepID=UPI000D6473F1|nr:platelet glycoprotein 4-like [Tetranychus urticae]